MNRPARLRYLLGALALAFSLAGCGGEDEPAKADESPPAGQSDSPTEATPSGVLDFATVESLTATRFASDPKCAYGVWSENPTGIAEKHRAAATMIQQFDCYRNEGQVGGFPERGYQSVYVEFEDAAAADAFARDEYYGRLVADNVVVLAGMGLNKSVDMEAYLADLQTACGCGEIFPNEF